jgi:hypothetical protein
VSVLYPGRSAVLNPLQNLLLQVKPSGGDAGNLRPGQLLQATVQGEPGNLFLQLGGLRVPLRNLPQLFAGQVVDAQILQVKPALELQLTPRSVDLPIPRDLAQALAQKPTGALQTIVQQDTGGPFIRVGGVRIPLPPDVPFLLGQNLKLDLGTAEGRPILRLLPQPNPGAQTPPAPPPAAAPNAPAATATFQQTPSAPVTPPTFRIPLEPQTAPLASLPPQAVPVQVDADGPFIVVSQQRIALPTETGALAGQSVIVQVSQEAGIPMALVWSSDATSTALPTPPAAAPEISGTLGRLLNNVLQVLGRDLSAEQAAPLLPRNLPQTETAVRQLLTVLASREQMSADLGRMTRLLSAAAALGGAPPETAAAFRAAVQQFASMEAEDLQVQLRQLVETRSPEARIALALKSESPNEAVQRMAGELRSQVAVLRDDESLLNVLRATRQADVFQEAASRVLDRLSGTELQNLRSLEQPYLFLNLPLPYGQALRRAQIHFFNDGQRKRQFDRDNATIAMDLELEQLGAMWVSLRVARGNCVCRFNADTPEVVTAIRDAAPELVESLQDAGYRNARVEAALWEGDRLQEVTRLMRRFAGLDASA